MNPTSPRPLRILAIGVALAVAVAWPATAAYADPPTSGTVTGIVTDASTHAPIDGATVTVRTNSGSRTVQTASDGSYTATGVAFDSLYNYVSATHDGYGAGSGSFAELNAGSASATVDLELPVTDATIHGTVTDAATQAGIGGVSLSVFSDDQNFQAVTNPDGTFSLAIVPSSYDVSLSPNGYVTQQINNIVVDRGENYLLNVALVPADSTLSGRVTDPNGNGVVGLYVSATPTASADGPYLGSPTDADGNYSIDGLGAGSWDVTAGGGDEASGADSSGNYWSLATRTISVPGAGDVTADFQLNPVPVGSISGHVLDANGDPMAGICAVVVDPSTGDFLANASGMDGTDSDGYFSSDTVPAGVDTIEFSDCGYVRDVDDRVATSYLGDGFNRAHAQTFTLSGGGSVDDLTAHMTLGGVIRGTSQVRTPDGSAPLPGSRVLNVRPNLYQKVNGAWEQIPYDSPYFGDDDGYVMFGLPPVDLCVGFIDTSTGPTAFSPTYYSGAQSCDDATLVHVTPGTPVDGVTALLSIPRPGAEPVGVDDYSEGGEGVIGSDSQLTQGQQTQIDVGTEHAGEWLSAFGHSTPTSFGDWYQVSSTGKITVTVPTTLAPGQHSLVVQSADGQVLGWNPVTVLAGSQSSGSGSGSGSSSAGTGSSIASKMKSADIVGEGGAGSTAVSSPLTLDEIISEYGADTSELLAKYLKDTGKSVPPDLSSLIASGGGDGLDLTDFSAWLSWSGADSTVSVYGYSSPTYLGRFSVVNGVAQLAGIDLTKLGEGAHNLLVVGDQSGKYELGAFQVSPSGTPAPTPQAAPATKSRESATDAGFPIGWVLAGLVLVLVVGAFVAVAVTRRRRA